jgi:hypothetical protein
MNKKMILCCMFLSAFSIASVFSQGVKEESEYFLTVSEKNDTFGSTAAKEKENLSLEDMLRYALEDERLALAEYEYILNEFNVSRPFINIIEAEKSHEQALLNLYDSYDLVVEDFNGADHIILPDTLLEIYNIGVEAEIANIAMYDKFLSYELPDDVRVVFESLKNGSINHLAAFSKQIR